MAWRLVRSTQNCHAVKDPKARMSKGLWIDRYERLRKVCWLAKHHATATAASSPSLQVCSTAMYCGHFHARIMPEFIVALHRHGGA